MMVGLQSVVACNNLPLVSGGGSIPQPVGVTVSQGTTSQVPNYFAANPVSFFMYQGRFNPGLWGPATLGVNFVTVAMTADRPVFLVGTFPGGQFSGPGVIPGGAADFMIEARLNGMALPGGVVLLPSPISWTLYAGGDTQGSQLCSVQTWQEIYVQPGSDMRPGGQQPSTNLWSVRLAAAQWLPYSFLPSGLPATNPKQALVAACVQAAFACPPPYPGRGASTPPAASPGNYYNYAAEDFDLAGWLRALRGVSPQPLPAYCYDCAAAVAVFIALQQELQGLNVWGGYMLPFGWLTPAAYGALRGASGQSAIKAFSDHMVAVVDWGSQNGPTQLGVCDATMGPFLGNLAPADYLQQVLTNPETASTGWDKPPSGTRPKSLSPGSASLVKTVNGLRLTFGKH